MVAEDRVMATTTAGADVTPFSATQGAGGRQSP